MNKITNYASLVVYAVPPSVNHYVQHFRNGGHRKTDAAASFENLLALACLGARPVTADCFDVAITVCLGPGQRGDVDNFPKLVLDTIARRGLLRSPKGRPLTDSHIHRLTVQKFRGGNESKTFVLIKPFEK